MRRIARVAASATEETWLERALHAPHDEVDALVANAKEGELPRALDRGLPAMRFVKRFVLDHVQHEMFEQARSRTKRRDSFAGAAAQGARARRAPLPGLRQRAV